MSENPVEQVNPVGSASETTSGNEQALFQVLVQRFGEAKAEGKPLPEKVTRETMSQEIKMADVVDRRQDTKEEEAAAAGDV